MAVDEARLGEFMGMMVGYMTGGALCFSVWLGDELGLYLAMTGAGALSADDIAKRADCNARLVREWLDGQVAGGLVGYDAGTDTYELSDEAAMALADETWRQATEGKRTLRRSILCQDRNDKNRYLVLAFFDSPESAAVNSDFPETAAFANQTGAIVDAPLTFQDLDIIEDRT
jgi:hypothetical protein